MKVNLRRVLGVVLPICLVGFCGGAFYLGMHPRVSQAYRAYYITRESEISPTELARMYPVSANKALEISSNDLSVSGWPPNNCVKHNGRPIASVAFLSRRTFQSRGSIRLRFAGPSDTNYVATLNDQPLELHAEDTGRAVSLAFRSESLHDGENVLRIECRTQSIGGHTKPMVRWTVETFELLYHD